jgi:hypothetical protein
VIEDNIFAFTATPINLAPYDGIQMAGQYTIIRRNLFYNCLGPGMEITIYPKEALYNYGNRIYNNVFYSNHISGISISTISGNKFADNTIFNNIFYKNNFVQNDFRWIWYDTLNLKPVQILTGRTSDVRIINNAIYSSAIDELFTIAFGDRNNDSNPFPQTISWWEANFPDFISGTIQENPLFIDTATKNFHLAQSSPLIDKGRFLAKTIGQANLSTKMLLDTTNYFSDGNGITEGDTIQLEGQTITAIITNIDYITGTLTLNSPLSWQDGQGISLKYDGLAPDIGAFEYYGDNNSDVKANNISFPKEFFISPNPANDYITINTINLELNTKISINNMLGIEILSKILNNSNINISTQDFPSGIYYCTLNTGINKITKSFVIIK